MDRRNIDITVIEEIIEEELGDIIEDFDGELVDELVEVELTDEPMVDPLLERFESAWLAAEEIARDNSQGIAFTKEMRLMLTCTLMTNNEISELYEALDAIEMELSTFKG